MLEENLKHKISFTQSMINTDSKKLNDILKFRIELYQYILDVKINGNINAVRPTRTKNEPPLIIEPIYEPIDDPMDEPMDEPIYEPMDEPIYEPMDEPMNEPMDEPMDEPIYEPMDDGTSREENTEFLTDINDDDLKEQAEEEEKIREQLAQLELQKLLKKKPRTKKLRVI